jgi:hypothetical protein
VTADLIRTEVDAAPDLGVRNTQPEGIGRVVALNGLVAWNNLGRNVVFTDRALRPRAVFGSTLFPDEDEPSQYDLDVHAVLDAPELDMVLVVNHFGTVRGFRRADLTRPPAAGLIDAAAVWSFAADVERLAFADGRLIGSRPRREGAHGVLVSSPLSDLPGAGPIPAQLCGTSFGFGEVTALAVALSADRPVIAMGGDGVLALADLDGDEVVPRWEVHVGFRVAWVEWHDGTLWAAGPARVETIDDYDWDQLQGGGFTAVSLDGTPLVSGALPADVAWGTGGVAVARLGSTLVTAGRTGCLRLVDPRNPAMERSTPPLSHASLGIAHLAVVGRRAVWGFNRGGYRLHAYGPPGRGTA